jgi:hypothetical protein
MSAAPWCNRCSPPPPPHMHNECPAGRRDDASAAKSTLASAHMTAASGPEIMGSHADDDAIEREHMALFFKGSQLGAGAAVGDDGSKRLGAHTDLDATADDLAGMMTTFDSVDVDGASESQGSSGGRRGGPFSGGSEGDEQAAAPSEAGRRTAQSDGGGKLPPPHTHTHGHTHKQIITRAHNHQHAHALSPTYLWCAYSQPRVILSWCGVTAQVRGVLTATTLRVKTVHLAVRK